MIKKTRELDFDLDVPWFVENYGIVEETSDEDIFNFIADYLCGCDDGIYYGFSTTEVYEEYKDEIKSYAKDVKINLLDCFNEIIGDETYNDKLTKAIQMIKDKLK